jgi:hypothetical protein
MVALGEYRRLLCPCGCGYLSEISHAEVNEFRFQVDTPRCHARTAIIQAADRKKEQPTPEGLLYVATLLDD